MADYTIVNLLDIDDAVGDRLPGLEGRFARKHLGSTELGISRFTYEPNLRSPGGHSHREQEEAYVVISGSGRMRLDDEIREVRQWDVIRVAPPVVRAFEAGADGLDVIAVGDIAMMRTPDGHGGLELAKFHTPPAVRAEPESAPANALGIRRIMFAVDDIDDVVARLRSHGGELVGEIVQYEDIYRLCFLRGPEGIIIGLAEKLS